MTESTKCPRCGADLPANFPSGICPACLLQQGLSPSTFMSGAGSASGNSGSRSRHRWTPPTPADLTPRFPQLEIVELLGQGGMGAVYKVRQRDLDRWAALKILPDDVAHDPNFSERFQREARALALLGHQHIVIVYEFGQRDGVYFLLMEYVDGVNLRQAIRAGQISARDALGIVTQICDALQFAHEEGVVHRDIKPENILIDKRGRVKIADFGLAKMLGRSIEVATLTGTHQVMGTPVYMAPEQMEGTRGVDHRADIFSLGVVFYELLTGELPLGRFAPPSQKYSLDVRLDEVVLRTLEKEPDRRYQQASDVKGDVESIRSQPSVAPPAKSKKFRLGRFIKIGLASVFVLTIGLFAIRVVLVHAMTSAEKAMSNELFAVRQQLRHQQYMQTMNANRSLVPRTTDNASESSPADDNRDPNEKNAIVQFSAEGAKLNSSFGQNDLTAEHRVLVNQILTRIHKKYLELEARDHTQFEVKEDGTQVSTILPVHYISSAPGEPVVSSKQFADDVARLENELWNEIDAQIPFEQQRFLRQSLPLFAGDRQPFVVSDEFMSAPGGAMGAGMSPMGGGGSPQHGMPMMSMGGNGSPYSGSLRYEQLLGWKQDILPIRISIGRRGKWYRWTIEVCSGMSGDNRQYLFGNIVDRGEDPQLPIGLRRFWRADTPEGPKSALPQTIEATEVSIGTTTDLPFDAEPGPITPRSKESIREFNEPFLIEQPNPQTPPPSQPSPVSQLADPIRVDDVIQFTPDGPLLNPAFGPGVLTDKHQQIVNPILGRIHKEFLMIQRRHTEWILQPNGTHVSIISKFADDIARLENDLWSAIDAQLPLEQQTFLRKNLPLFAEYQKSNSPPDPIGDHSGSSKAPSRLRSMALLGWRQAASEQPGTAYTGDEIFPIVVAIARRGQWYRWSIEVFEKQMQLHSSGPSVFVPQFELVASGYDPILPSGIAHFLRDETKTDPVVKEGDKNVKVLGLSQTLGYLLTKSDAPAASDKSRSLVDELREIDSLRNGKQTPWDDVEKRTNALLDRFPSPADQGKIHWQAAHVYGQSAIQDHAENVIRHAKEALKYEKDPVQRAWLFMYLGNATEVREDHQKSFVDRRAEATRWYLKGYVELLPFHLPAEAPELPSVQKIGESLPSNRDGEIDSEQTSVEVRHAAQIKIRDETQITRDLVQKRDIYLSRIKDLFGRLHEMHDKSVDAEVRLRGIATRVIPDPKDIEVLVHMIFPDKSRGEK